MKTKDKKETPVCSDNCDYCVYINGGEFVCAATGRCDLVISDWTPKPCVCPKKRRVE